MECKASNIKNKWKIFSSDAIKTEIFDIDNSVINSMADIKKLLPNSVFLTENSIESEIGCLFNLFDYHDYMLKIKLGINNKISFEIIANKKLHEFAEKILDVFRFNFCECSY